MVPGGVNRSSYPSVPKQLWNLYDQLSADQPQHKLVEAIARQGAEKTWRGIDDIFRLASRAAGLSPDQMFDDLGLGRNDADSANFQAMLGSLRAINILSQHGFTEFKPLRPLRDRKEADFLAKRDGKLYAVEVFRSSEDAYRYASSDDRGSTFATWLQRRLQEKLPQISATMQAHSCVAGIAAVVMDSYPSKALNNAEEYQEAVRSAAQHAGVPGEIQVVLFTGMTDTHGNDECVWYPSSE